jgi:Na+-transporting NADH:ubiquinone oxidoreductase subunit C
MFSTKYVYIYTLTMAALAAISLAFVITVFKTTHEANEAVFKKKDILTSIKSELGFDPATKSNEEILDFFAKNVDKIVVDANGKIIEGVDAESISLSVEEKKAPADRQYPLFVYKGQKNKIYLTSVRGNGLWDKIWGTIAIKDDLNTIVGASFGHAAETPGLGAEIKDNPNFPKAFIGKQLFEKGEYMSITVKKGASNPVNEVDAISGATITSTGVSNMMYDGLKAYVPYFSTIKKS